MRRQQDDIDINEIDWKNAYFKLKRQYGLREVYAEMIHQCQLCKCLYWQVDFIDQIFFLSPKTFFLCSGFRSSMSI